MNGYIPSTVPCYEKGAESPTPELGSWQILQLQGTLDVPQAGKQGLHVLPLSQLCSGESADPHLQLQGNTTASASTQVCTVRQYLVF